MLFLWILWANYGLKWRPTVWGVRAHTRARACVCVCECTVSCRHVFLCRSRNKIKPSLVLKMSCVCLHCIYIHRWLYKLYKVCCYITSCMVIYSRDTSAVWSCAGWKMRDGRHSLAGCSPASSVIMYRRYETHLHGDLVWQGTPITARLPPSPPHSLSVWHTHLSSWSALLVMRNILTFRDVKSTGRLTDGGGGGGGEHMKVAWIRSRHQKVHYQLSHL